MRTYTVKFLTGDRAFNKTEIESPDIRSVTSLFWQWLRTNTFLECSEVRIWSVEPKNTCSSLLETWVKLLEEKLENE